MNFKIALAAAAVVGLAGTAQAADLAKKAPAAANYVKVCDAYGAGFFYIPGSETCLRVGGFVRFQGTVNAASRNWSVQHNAGGWSRNQHGIGTLARGDIQIDARTNTELGLLRSYMEVIADSTSYGGAGTNTYLYQGYIQFAGLTAGRAQSFFDFLSQYTLSSTATMLSNAQVNLLAYTFSFGNGISASLSIEDPSTSSTGNPLTSVNLRRSPYNAGVSGYGGVHTPDLVANVNVSQAWGSAQISGVLHDDLVATGALSNDSSKVGFAVLGGVKVNLPMLGAKDQFGIQAAYAKGANGYVLSGWQAVAAVGAPDFLINNGSIKQTSSASVYAGFTHGWTSSLTSNFGVAYSGFNGTRSDLDFRQTDVRGNLAWTPVKGLAITGEVSYVNVDYAAERNVLGLRDENLTKFDLRIQRSF